jgi:UDPglucose 6-dehydrogenase
MKVLIIGYGYVGRAIGSVFNSKELTIIDPLINKNKISNFKEKRFDAVFVSVDTPLNEEFKTLECVLRDLNTYMIKNTVVCCKSTALPSFYINAEKKYKNIRLIFCPEYLSHYSNIIDFKNQTFCILGGEITSCRKIKKILFNKLKKLKNVYFTDIGTAAFVKYAVNSFLAFKITFFNELFEMHEKLELRSSFNKMKNLVILDKRVGISHTQVPGRDKKRGWGGHCLPKDITEFYRITKSKLLKELLYANRNHRKKS